MRSRITAYALVLCIIAALGAPAAKAAPLPCPADKTNCAIGGELRLKAAAGVTPEESQAASSYERLMDQLWNRTASFRPLVDFQIQTVPDKGKPFIDGMDQGTQIVPINGVWYLFNREYDFAPRPSQCPRDFSRIVVRKSIDHGHTWSNEVIIAQPNLTQGECALGDGYAYWDGDTRTWHYLAQMLAANRQGWNIDHFTRQDSDPMGSFLADPGNPVIRGGALWSKICGPGKACPRGTGQEGTPEISLKANGFYYVTFHGALLIKKDPPVVAGFRGIAKTRDWHTWITSDRDMPDDAIWSGRDCQGWNVAWNKETGCIGGGHASTLITPEYTYMLIELADISLQCTAGQHWAIGLARANGFQVSGRWQQWPGNPLMINENGAPCSLQYPRLFKEGGHIYLSYWTLGPTGAHDPNTMFHIAELVPVH